MTRQVVAVYPDASTNCPLLPSEGPQQNSEGTRERLIAFLAWTIINIRGTFLKSRWRLRTRPVGYRALCCFDLYHTLSSSQKTHQPLLLHLCEWIFCCSILARGDACSKHWSTALKKQVFPMFMRPQPTLFIVVLTNYPWVGLTTSNWRFARWCANDSFFPRYNIYQPNLLIADFFH